MAIPLSTKPTVIIGQERIEVKPLNLENALGLIILLAPHLALIEEHLPEIKRALAAGKDRPQLLSVIFMALRKEMVKTPGDMVKAFSLLIDRDYEWIARNAKAEDLLKALPILNRVNDFGELWKLAKQLGLVIRYG